MAQTATREQGQGCTIARPLLREVLRLLSEFHDDVVEGAIDEARKVHFYGTDHLIAPPPLHYPATAEEAFAPFGDEYLDTLIDELMKDQYEHPLFVITPPPPTYKLPKQRKRRTTKKR